MKISLMVADPVTLPSLDDPGDETQRNYRYQHAYGVILLLGAIRGDFPYITLYSEHHEDFLCQKANGKYDAYQIKTSQPENGAWELSDEGLRKSLRRFVELHRKSGEYIEEFKFVSNTNFSEQLSTIQDQKRLGRSPIRFTESVSQCSCREDVLSVYQGVLDDLTSYCNCAFDELIAVIKKLKLITGPTRDAFDSEICMLHLSKIDECAGYPAPQLAAIRDELITKVHRASSLAIDDPAKHWYPHNNNASAENDPKVKSKRITVTDIKQIIADKASPPFRYTDGLPTLDIGSGGGKIEILKKKMDRGDLYEQIETMERRTLSAEQRLIEIAHKHADTKSKFDHILYHLESVVQAECDEARLNASLNISGKYGRYMLNDVMNRLKSISKDDPEHVFREKYETLIGIAGLLTADCKIWWSEHFSISGAL